MQPDMERSLELLQQAEVAASANSVPAIISILAVTVFLAWAVWYLTEKLDLVQRGENPDTLFQKVFGRR